MRFNHGAYFWVPYIDGKQRWHPLGRDFATAFEKYGRLEAGRHETPGTKFEDLDRRFFAEVAPKYAANTRKNYRSWIKPLRAVFTGVHIAALRQRDAAQYLDRRGRKTSGNREIALLSTMLGFAVRWGWIDANPLRGFAKLPETRRTRYITDDELARLLAAADPLMRVLIAFAHETALRKGDVLVLRWADVKPDGLHVQTQKTAVPMIFALTPELARLLADARALQSKIGSMFIFASRRGQRLNAVTVDHRWAAIRDRAGLGDVVFHDLRRKRLTDAADRVGRDFAQRLGGHKEARTTARYYTPDAIRVDLGVMSRPASGEGSGAK